MGHGPENEIVVIRRSGLTIIELELVGTHLSARLFVLHTNHRFNCHDRIIALNKYSSNVSETVQDGDAW